MKKISSFIRQNLLAVTGMLIGGIGGWSYWYFIGCASGTCPITAHPVNSTIYGMFMGALLFSMFKKEKKVESIKD